MIELARVGDRIELLGYARDASLADLAEAVNRFRVQPGLITGFCHMCAHCCYDPIPLLGYDLAAVRRAAERTGRDPGACLVLPERPERGARRRAIARLQRDMSIGLAEATLLYEANSAEPITLARGPLGGCAFLQGALCSIYAERPFACALYLCNMGERLGGLYETIVVQGIWHSYQAMGWIAAEEIPGNPFLRASSFAEVAVSDFERRGEGGGEGLFFYF